VRESILKISKGGILMIEVGTLAPGFTLKDQNGKNVKLASLKGKRVLLSFRPLAWTPV
jgi:peroxiredoxin